VASGNFSEKWSQDGRFRAASWLHPDEPHAGGSVMDMKLELVSIPVADVDRAKAFYEQVGFNTDHDHQVSEEMRFVQLTPPGSACSIAIGTGIGINATPGSVEGMQMVVSDIDAAHAELSGRGIAVSEVEDFAWGSFLSFSDPDGNCWALQQITPRT
jgi:predicted enzyme related to lactoylglutathione lyase